MDHPVKPTSAILLDCIVWKDRSVYYLVFLVFYVNQNQLSDNLVNRSRRKQTHNTKPFF